MNDFSEFSEMCERMQLALRKRNMKQVELSRLSGIDGGTISNYLYGKYKPKQDKLVKIAEVLDVNPAWLLGYDVPMERVKETPDKITLTEGEEMLLELFRQIPEEQQRVFLDMGRVYANSLKKD